jgi:Tol biopolymer transport system component
LLLFIRISPETGSDVYVLSLRGDPKPRPVVNSTAYEGGPQFSPDGRWIAYASNESGSFQIYVRPFPGPDRKVQISTEGGSHPLWNRRGHELFYRYGNKMIAVDVATGALNADPVVSAPRVLFDQRYSFVGNTIASYDISADGQRFAFIKPESTANRLNLVINWFEELKARVPTK